MKKIIISVYFLSLMVFSGCSTKVLNMSESYNRLRLKIDSESSKKYYLVDKTGNKITSAISSNGYLTFHIPAYVSAEQCFFIKNHKNENVKLADGSSQGIRLSILKEYQTVSSKIANIEEEIKNTQERMDDLKRVYFETKNALEQNRAYNDGSCSVPPMKTLPPKPSDVVCMSERECKQDALLVCVKVLISSEACSQAAKKEGYSSFESSAICGALAATSLKQKYNLEDATNDSLFGAIDDYADEKLENGGFWGQLGGIFLKTVTVQRKQQQVKECQLNFLAKYYNAYLEWKNERERIEQEPDRLYRDCQRGIEKMKESKRYYFQKENFLATLKKKREVLLSELEKLKVAKSNNIEICD